MRWRALLAASTAVAALCVCVLFVIVGPSASPSKVIASHPGGQAVSSEGPTTAEQAGIAASDKDDSPLDGARANSEADDARVFEQGHMLVTLSEGTSPENAVDALATAPGLAGISLAEVVSDGLVRLALPEGVTVRQAVETAKATGVVSGAQPNYRYYTQENAADSKMASALLAQTRKEASADLISGTALGDALNGSLSPQAISVNDRRYSQQWGLESMNVPEAWETLTDAPGSKNVTVAVMDEGFLTSHEDLMDVVVSPYNASYSRSNTLTAYNPYHSSHGTHVAGIIAAQANNEVGIAGVAYNTDDFSTCSLMPIRVAESNGDIYTSTISKGYSYLLGNYYFSTRAKTYNVRVVNLSLGTDRTLEDEGPDEALERSIARAWNAGIVTVAAACNIDDYDYYTPFACWPADCDNVVGVISLAKSNNADGVDRSKSSNFNTAKTASAGTKNISAPGASILSTYSNDYSSSPVTNSYTSLTGTSMATPMVSGVLALMFRANPNLSASEAVGKLYSSARDLTEGWGMKEGWDAVSGYGEADAAAAVSSVLRYELSGATSVSWGSTAAIAVRSNDVVQDASSWSWSSSNPSAVRIASVTSRGCFITAAGNGKATITAEKNGTKLTRTVTATWPVLEAPSSMIYGDTAQLSVKLGSTTQVASAWSWSSSRPDVVAVSATGEAVALGYGEATVSATCNGLTLTRAINVGDAMDISDLDISFPAVTYTGAPIEPIPVVSNGSVSLQNASDFRVISYENNVNAGTAKVTIGGIGRYTGQITKSFKIEKKKLTASNIKLSTTKFTYNGKKQKPGVTVNVSLNGVSTALKSGKDYTLANNGTKKGTGTVTVKGSGNFTGTAKKTYSVSIKSTKVYRLYNKTTKQWFYTTVASQYNSMKSSGWTGKGTAFKMPSKSNKPVYCMYNAKTKAYQLAVGNASKQRWKSVGWKCVQVAFYADDYKSTPVHYHYRASTKTRCYSTAASLDGYEYRSTPFYAL